MLLPIYYLFKLLKGFLLEASRVFPPNNSNWPVNMHVHVN